jgi:hypothetical protein
MKEGGVRKMRQNAWLRRDEKKRKIGDREVKFSRNFKNNPEQQ